MFPIQGNERAVGLDLLNDTVSGVPQRYSGILAAVQARGVTMNGPYVLLNGGVGIGVNAPIFVPASSPAQRFGQPDAVSDYCGAPCAYNSSAGLAFWGLVRAFLGAAAQLGIPYTIGGGARGGGYARMRGPCVRPCATSAYTPVFRRRRWP